MVTIAPYGRPSVAITLTPADAAAWRRLEQERERTAYGPGWRPYPLDGCSRPPLAGPVPYVSTTPAPAATPKRSPVGLAGYALRWNVPTFGPVDSAGHVRMREVFAPGAFARALATRRDVTLLRGHD